MLINKGQSSCQKNRLSARRNATALANGENVHADRCLDRETSAFRHETGFEAMRRSGGRDGSWLFHSVGDNTTRNGSTAGALRSGTSKSFAVSFSPSVLARDFLPARPQRL